MKLYYSAGACSFAAHIALLEAGIPFTAVAVDLKAKRTADGADFLAISDKGSVPALQMDEGAVLTEVSAVLQYIADLAPGSALAPAHGTFARYRLAEWLNFIATEIHKSFEPLWNPAITDDAKAAAHKTLTRRFDYVSKRLASTPWLMGDGFTVADCYFYTMLVWTKFVKFDLAPWPVLQDYVARMAARPAVQQARAAESPKK